MKYLIYVVTLSLLIITACKKNKTEDTPSPVAKPKSAFKVLVYDINFKQKKDAITTGLDSAFYFQNLSDQGTDITYTWDFGDGTHSQLKDPSHVYASTGRFTVKLITTRNNTSNAAHDTSQVLLSVIIGQREISLGQTITTSATNMVETNDNGYLLLGTSNDVKVFPYEISTFIMKLDAKFKQQSFKKFPINIQFNSIGTCTDGNFIFTGTTAGNNIKNELIKTTADGTILWSKVMNTDGLVNVQQTPDNGFILTGIRNITDRSNNKYPKTLIIKTDGNGNQQWERFFGVDLGLEQTYNTVVENDGYTIAGAKLYTPVPNVYCANCDSVGVIKINPAGTIQWKSIHKWGLNASGIGPVYLSKMQTGGYCATSRSLSGALQFTSAGDFSNLITLSYSPWLNASAVDGPVIILQLTGGNGFTSEILGYSPNGVYNWKVGVNTPTTLPNGQISSGSDSWPVAVLPLKAGGAMFLSNNVAFSDYHYSTEIVKVDKNGIVQ
jgi:PKD repeat protein